MIKPIQLLKDSFATYKANIKNIIFMTWPIALLTIVAGYYSNQIDGMGKYKPMILSVFIIGALVNIIISIVISLFLQPALFRSIQKNEDNKNFNVKDGYNFQKKNIWNYIVLYFWTLVYYIKVNWKYLVTIIVTVGIVTAGVIASSIQPAITMIILSVLLVFGSVVLVLMVIKNTAKFVYPTNVFFSEEIRPRDAVKKAIDIGAKNNGKVWLNILSYILLSIILMFIYFIIGFISSVLPGAVTKDMFAIILSSLVVAFIGTPMTFIVFAKGYNVLKGKVEEEVVVGE